jgi:outer membrane protein OmpA-like peptidoglycan-associated protein
MVVACALASLASFASRTAAAQEDPRHAVDRFEPAERGSEWFANESLDLRGRVRPSAGYVIAISHLSRPPTSDLAYLHVGGSIVLVDRLRIAVNLPFQLNASGESTTLDGAFLPAPRKSEGVGDLRLGIDVRLFGTHRGTITGALGVQAWAPTGQQSQWASDGVFRVRPRAMVSGEIGAFVWAAQVGFLARERSEITASAASGVRFAKAIVVGPEIFASTVTPSAFAKRDTPVEVLLGVHWLVDGTGRIAGGVGRGLTDGFGASSWRAIFTIEWAPELVVARHRPRDDGRSGRGAKPGGVGPDADHDGVPDATDACPEVVGIKTNDPKTNGCPPDADDDGVDDLADACPTLRGIATSDPTTTGCPDRDRDADGVPNDVDACPDDRGAPDVDPRRNGCPKAFVRELRIVVLDQVEFKPGTADIVASPENESLLTAVLAALLKLPEGRRVRIEGHTDDRGDAGLNRKLGAARAAAVARWLAEHGIDRARMTALGVGPDRPIATNETEAGRAENRRLEFHLDP